MTFYKNKRIYRTSDIDVNNILVSKNGNKNSVKYFIGYNDNDIIRPLFINFRKWQVIVKYSMKIQQCLLW